MALTDSCCAVSMNEQVLTTMMSASPAVDVISAPEDARRPIMTSESTRFLGHPRLTKPTFLRETEALSGAATVRVSTGMESTHFSSSGPAQSGSNESTAPRHRDREAGRQGEEEFKMQNSKLILYVSEFIGCF